MSRSLTFPFSADDYQEAVRAVEEEAQEIWDSTHGCDDCGMDGAINPECKTCKGEGTIL
jgi:DnaJ-class molecular chaperone